MLRESLHCTDRRNLYHLPKRIFDEDSHSDAAREIWLITEVISKGILLGDEVAAEILSAQG